MYISDEETVDRIIGQAVMHLLLSSQDVTVGLLLTELKSLAEIETDDERLMQLHETRRWLAGYCSLSSRSPERAGWLDDKFNSGITLSLFK